MEREKALSTDLPVQITELARALVFASISILSFFVPFAFGHPQWLVGTIVNACLFTAAIYLPRKYFVPLAVLPSLGVLARGIIFGPLTFFLVYFLPFIWLGNSILLFVFSRICNTQKTIPLKSGMAVVGSAGLKFLVLFGAANIYFKFGVVPAVFLQTMGLFQLATALVGGVVAFLFNKIIILKFLRTLE